MPLARLLGSGLKTYQCRKPKCYDERKAGIGSRHDG
jgi:hypothetical protein